MNKGLWIGKGSGHVNDGDATLSNPARIGHKRSQQWFVDTAESDLFPNKKQLVQTVNSKLSPGMLYASVPLWENTSGLQTVPNQFINRLFGPETRSIDYAERNISSVGTDDLSVRRKGADNQYGDEPLGLSMAHAMENPETCLNYGGIRKVKVNKVKDSDSNMHAPREPGSDIENNSNLAPSVAFDSGNETGFGSIKHRYVKEHDSLMLMSHTYNRDDGNSHIGSDLPNYGRGDDNTISLGDTFSKGDTTILSFGGFPDEQDIIPVGKPVVSYEELFNQPSVQTSEAASEKVYIASNVNAVVNISHPVKPKSETVSKNKTARKEAPNSFPSNVRSLISTGMLDGVPVKYVSLAREELRGIIKGSGYLCGCQSCNYSKVLNAYEFERHAGCKTKHPNNHIYFENGKTIYQIVQELRSTPENMLFDTIQTVFGAPINQKSFRIWKESFQAATRELQRIYGKEELNM
ncbi:hypothetical protein UlMin_013507 [Ulmus minor]